WPMMPADFAFSPHFASLSSYPRAAHVSRHPRERTAVRARPFAAIPAQAEIHGRRTGGSRRRWVPASAPAGDALARGIRDAACGTAG
ncbi:hypothetical protein NYZ21_21715, partial [Acinetobacter baumannii]|nr:hypothetical protein [Acinetobacter baumannii]